MDLDSMIAVLEAAKRGEEIEVLNSAGWHICVNPEFSFPMDRYRIAPKKEMTLVEELRKALSLPHYTTAIDQLKAGYELQIKTLREALEAAEELNNVGLFNAAEGQITRVNDLRKAALSLPHDTSALQHASHEERLRLDALVKDAERYRWLLDYGKPDLWVRYARMESYDDVEAAIDAAIKGSHG